MFSRFYLKYIARNAFKHIVYTLPSLYLFNVYWGKKMFYSNPVIITAIIIVDF